MSCSHSRDIKLNESDLIEIENLNSDSKRSSYLTQLFVYDQELRNDDEFNIISEFGYDSEEHNKHRKKSFINDTKNFLKLKAYLNKYGYPVNPEEYDKVGISGIPYIIGHTGDADVQKEIFPIIHKAYKDGYCPIDDVVWILSEMYESKYGELYKMKSARFTAEQEYQELMVANDLISK